MGDEGGAGVSEIEILFRFILAVIFLSVGILLLLEDRNDRDIFWGVVSFVAGLGQIVLIILNGKAV